MKIKSREEIAVELKRINERKIKPEKDDRSEVMAMCYSQAAPPSWERDYNGKYTFDIHW